MSRPSWVQSRQSFGDAAGVDYMAPTRQRSPEERLVLAVLCDAVDSLSHPSKQARVDAARWIEDRCELPWSFGWACSIFGFDADAFRERLCPKLEAARSDDVPAYVRRIVTNHTGHSGRKLYSDFQGHSGHTRVSVNRVRDHTKQVSAERLKRVVAAVAIYPDRTHVRQVYGALRDVNPNSIRFAVKIARSLGLITRVGYGYYARRAI